MSQTITRHEFHRLEEDPEVCVRERYSGRGMFGESCVGFVLDAASELAHLQERLRDILGPEKARALAECFSQDAMGRGVIFYARGWEVEAPSLKTYQITVKEIREITYQVQAENEEKGKLAVLEGYGDEVNNEHSSFHTKPEEWEVHEKTADSRSDVAEGRGSPDL